MLRELGAAVSLCPSPHLLTVSLPPRLVADDNNTSLPETVQTVVNHLGPLLAADDRSVRLTAYKLLSKLIPELARRSVDTVRCTLSSLSVQ